MVHPSQPVIFEYLARWAEVLELEDYDAATAAIRETTAEEAVGRVAYCAGLEPATGLEPIECLIDLEARVAAELWPRYGIKPSSDAAVVARERDLPRLAALCLRGGPLHARFWHWMDRFYYEVYGPWRRDHVQAIESLERRAIDGLGARQGTAPPDLGWLPPFNPLIAMPSLRAAAEEGVFEVVFWADPFGLESALTVGPGFFLTSFGEAGVDREISETVRAELATKLKALADPTRLWILRMIRNMDVDNTELAAFVEVSRPTVSVHAKLLADAGFITTRREGRRARHIFHPEAIRHLSEQLARFLEVSE
jgi:ArsR family transcriptional regulator